MNTTLKVRPCSDPRFQLVLVDSQLLPGRKAWKLMLVEDQNTAKKGAA